MNENNQINANTKKGSGKGCAIAVIIAVLFLSGAYIFYSYFLPFLGVFRWSDNEEESQKQLEKIVESIQPAPERDYQFSEPSAQTLKKNVDCKKMISFQDELPIINPICLNLYRTSSEEINKKVAEGKYDRVILYGENIVWDAPIIKDSKNPEWNQGKAIIDSARFNDQITLPRLLKLYGFSDTGFVNALASKDKALPLAALYFRLGSEEEVKKVCQSENAAGCAFGMWATIIPQHVLGEVISLPNQKVWRITDEKDPDWLAFDYLWPRNCYTDGTLIHETAHLLLYAERLNNITDALVSSRYFNEHQADAVKIAGTNLICGNGSVSNFRSKSGKKTGLFEFNSIYPPTKMGSVWPSAKDTCQLALLNEWNRFMAGGDFEKQFIAFTSSLRGWMKQGKTISNDRDFFDFILQLNPDKNTKNNLQYRNCQF